MSLSIACALLAASTIAPASADALEVSVAAPTPTAAPASVQAPALPKVEVAPLPAVEVPSVPPVVGGVVETGKAAVETTTTAVEQTKAKVEETAKTVVGTGTSGGGAVEKTRTTTEEVTNVVPKPSGGSSSGSPRPTGAASSATAAATGSQPSQGTGLAGPQAGTSVRHPAGGPSGGSKVSAEAHPAGGVGAEAASARLAPVSTPAPAAGLGVAAPLRNAAERTRTMSDPLSSLGRHIPLPLPVPDWSKPIILLLALLALAFAARAWLVSRRARRLEHERGVLLESVGAMQAALVPAVPPRVGELSVSVAYQPAAGPAAGGDFYDVFALDATRAAIIVGDVAGHGQGALKQAALTRFTLRAYLQAGIEPRAALALAGAVLEDESADNFATVILAVYDRSSGRLTYASAGHPPPLAIGIDMPEPLTVCCSPPLGWDVQTGRRQTSLAVPVGRALCFFSDGLIEARTENGLLGRERVQAIAERLPAPFDARTLLDLVREHATATPDDMVACIISPHGVSGSGGHVEELEVDAAALASGQAERFLEAFAVEGQRLERALAQTAEMIAAHDSAILRVGLDGLAAAGAVSVHEGLELTSAEPLPSERMRARQLAAAS